MTAHPMKLISSIFSRLESDAWWNIDIKFHFHFEFFVSSAVKGEIYEIRWLNVSRFPSTFQVDQLKDLPERRFSGFSVNWQIFSTKSLVFFEVTFLTTSFLTQVVFLSSPLPSANNFVGGLKRQIFFINSSFITLCWNYYVYS